MFNLAVAGCGRWGPNHVRVFNDLKESVVSAVADPDSARLERIGHVFLFNPGIVKAKEIIDSAELGTLRYMSAVRTNLGPIRSDVTEA